jgi:hypothetical protein
VTLGVSLCDVPAERGPLTCVAGSHRGPIFEHRDNHGAWTGAIVRGAPARVAHLDPTPCPVPPDWSRDGYGSIFTAQDGRGSV